MELLTTYGHTFERYADVYKIDDGLYSITLTDYETRQGGHLRSTNFDDACIIAKCFVDKLIEFKFDYNKGLTFA